MSNNKLTELTISYTKRNARAKGPTSSEAWNDNSDELVRDLAAIYTQWNNSLVPLLSLLPTEEDNYSIDAYTDGLDGRTLFVNAESSADDAVDYYNAGQTRPNTIYEQFQSVYSFIESRVNTVEDQIDSVALAAADISIADSGAVFTSGTVEGALQEVMNLVARTGTDHGSLQNLSDDDHTQYLPRSGVRAMTGSLQMGGQNIIMTSNVIWRTGTGSPEGVVTASVGSLYTDLTGGVSTTLYVKTSGSGNTGWTAK